jgi:hypothetical protein
VQYQLLVGMYMAQESIWRSKHEPEMRPSDSHVTLSKPRREILTRAKEALGEAGTLGLLVILAVEESVRHRRSPPPSDIEQLREYGDWVD